MLRSLLVVFLVLCPMASAYAQSGTKVASITTNAAIGSADGVRIAYTSTGTGRPAIVFIHGGYADQSFWKEQIEPLSQRFQVITLDLAGHGASEERHREWTMDMYGEDVRAVVRALDLDSVVLVGNSLGGPVAIAAAKKLPGLVRGIVAVDTFQDVQLEWPEEARQAYVQALKDDFPAACAVMVEQLLLEGTDPDLYAWVEDKMCRFDPEIAPRVVEASLDYDLAAEFAGAEVPIRAVLGETIPLNLEGNRELRPHFDAVVMEGCGHYPMLERPEEFNQHLLAFLDELGGP
jgi:pimeloyl-ACP methyl ester carboxylesterase